jgi:ABC-2 type transport system permease protein
MNDFAGTGSLLRLILRRDRWLLLVWIAITGLVPFSVASSFKGLYATADAIRAYAAASASTPSAVAILGNVYAATVGGLVAWRTGLNTAFLVAPVAVLFVVRHTRKEEETGRTELVRGGAVGRFAPLTAALLEMVLAGLAIAALIAGGLVSTGLPAAGSIVLGLSGASIVWTFAAVAALSAQLSENAGSARGIGLALLAFAWLVRGAGDVTGATWLSWLSPLGWARLTRAFAGEQWWVLLLPLAFFGVVSAGAYALSARRDLYGGLLPTRQGPAAAAPSLRTPLALAWRLDRGALTGWFVGAALFGVMLGSVGAGIGRYVDNTPLSGWASRMGAGTAGAAFFFAIIYIVGQVLAAYAVTATLRMRAEETEGRVDPVLSGSVSRSSWAGSHLVMAMLGSAVVVGVFGLLTGLTYGASVGDVTGQLPPLLGRALAVVPAVWVMAGIAAALYGWLPRIAVPATWTVFGAFLLLELGWELQRVSSAAFDISPFAWVHWARPVSLAALAGLTVAAALLTAVGLFGFSRRDVGVG